MIDLPLPPSTHSKNRDAMRSWAADVAVLLSNLQRPAARTFEVVLDFHAPWFRADGTLDPKQPDIDRMVHHLLDLIASQCGYNDRANHRVVLNKVQSQQRKCVVWLRPCPLQVPGF